MTDQRNKALEYAHQERDRFIEELSDLIAIPSNSTDSAFNDEVQRAAEWLEARLGKMGFENIQIIPTDGKPVVYGEHNGAGADRPTMIVYGHYDVQPEDPLDQWDSEPFKATIKDDVLVARGASDMKGQVIASFAAIESALHAGGVPVNMKFLLEGEEETGSPALDKFMEQHKDLLKSDFALNTDAGMLSPDQPTITYALRGLVYLELTIKGPSHDLHSGLYGGVIRNPANEMASLIAGMHDADNRVTLPGFYDSVRELDDEERGELARLPQTDDFYKGQTGVSDLWGEKGYTPVERATARPTLEVNGLLSGYTGEGSKTVLPAEAMAKISCRLVADQDPDEVQAQFEQYVKDNIHPSMEWHVKQHSKAVASISERDSNEVQAMMQGLEEVWGTRPLLKREGGTIPVVGYFQSILGIETVNTGFGLPEDRMHSPNERLHLPTWEKGIDALIHFIYNLA